ncbi:unnamed protein product [Caenorhabditis angaria]|uniref:Apple domain-containing protein n=1 Tax=Caenorhabditis angaria TaxID=860376 RepID=A0A9P1J527_9PELO|nr:unnamed protein product [Caenorhabditis angaria]
MKFQLALLFLYSVSAKNLPLKGGCENSGFFVSDNTVLKSQDAIVYKDTSEDECLRICHQNRDEFERPIDCSSFSYDHSTFSCTIYKEKSVPLGESEISPSAGKRYFEKVCLPKNLPQCSASQFIRVDQSVLVGYAANLTLVDSIELCIAQCIQEQGCLSAMYFYEDGECITNKESALTKPAAFSKEENDKVVYFQNGCDPSEVVEASGNSEEIVEEEEEATTVSTTTTTEKTTTTTEEAPVEEEETEAAEEEEGAEEGGEEAEYEEEEEEEEEVTTTTTPKPVQKPIKKIKKNPKNFASKTYKALKSEKTEKKLNIQKVEEAQEEVEEKEENYFSEWSDWTPCTKSQERQIRRRRCLNLRKCLGALMQVQNCPSIIPTTSTPSNIESIRSVVNVNGEDYDDTSIPIVSEPIPQLLNEQVWGPWQGTCQHFASSQPCNNGNMIGFESRECIAKDPAQCEGPFFRYCTLTC